MPVEPCDRKDRRNITQWLIKCATSGSTECKCGTLWSASPQMPYAGCVWPARFAAEIYEGWLEATRSFIDYLRKARRHYEP
jgi:hypothetical protein